MSDNDPMKITVTTQFNEDLIRQFTDMANHRMQEGVIQLREKGIREALVKLGWTPPDGDAFLEGVKAGLEAAKGVAQGYDAEVEGYYVGQQDASTSIAAGIDALIPATITRKGGADG